MTKPRTIKAWGVFTKRGALFIVELERKWAASCGAGRKMPTAKRTPLTPSGASPSPSMR